MAKKWDELRSKLDEQPDIDERRAKARAELDRELEEWTATLGALRKARGLTQTQLADALEVSQAQVSRIERQTDLFLSTLRSYVEAMGGRLELIAAFDDGDAKVIDLRDLRPSEDEAVPADLMTALESAIAAAKASSRQFEVVSKQGGAGAALAAGGAARLAITQVLGEHVGKLVEITQTDEGEILITETEKRPRAKNV